MLLLFSVVLVSWVVLLSECVELATVVLSILRPSVVDESVSFAGCVTVEFDLV